LHCHKFPQTSETEDEEEGHREEKEEKKTRNDQFVWKEFTPNSTKKKRKTTPKPYFGIHNHVGIIYNGISL